MYKLLPLAVLGLASVAANAAGSYALTFVYAYNPFSPLGTSVLIGSVPTSGTASVDGAGNVSASGISHSFTNVSSAYNYTSGTWSAVVGGTAVTHSEICTETAGLPCTGLLSGLTGIWNNSQTNGGAASSICSASTFFPAGNCDAVSIVEVAGSGRSACRAASPSAPATAPR